MLSSDKSSISRRKAWDTVVENLLDELLQGAFNQAHNPVLQKGVDEVHQQLKDPVEGSKSGDVNVNVTDVADVEVGQLQSSTAGNVHLSVNVYSKVCNTH